MRILSPAEPTGGGQTGQDFPHAENLPSSALRSFKTVAAFTARGRSTDCSGRPYQQRPDSLISWNYHGQHELQTSTVRLFVRRECIDLPEALWKTLIR